MKTLFLVRHAKSDWSNHNFSDKERPINQRGLRDAPLMAQRLKLLNIPINEIISSPAVRAWSTAKIFAEFLDYPLPKIKQEPLLYEADVKLFLSVINKLPESKDTVMIFGHNPTLTEMIDYLADHELSKLPTCGIAMIAFDLESWKFISRNTGELKMLDSPKKI